MTREAPSAWVAVLASRVFHWAFLSILTLGLTCGDVAGALRPPKVKKLLPHFLDFDGKHALSPSLYERDAYQAFLRKNKNLRSGLRFDVLLKGTPPPGSRLRIELRGALAGARTEAVVEDTFEFRRRPRHWRELFLKGEEYLRFGELVAWRATLWHGDDLLSEHKSFLW